MTAARQQEIANLMVKESLDYETALITCPDCNHSPLSDATLRDPDNDEEIGTGVMYCPQTGCGWAESGGADDPTQEGEG